MTAINESQHHSSDSLLQTFSSYHAFHFSGSTVAGNAHIDLEYPLTISVQFAYTRILLYTPFLFALGVWTTTIEQNPHYYRAVASSLEVVPRPYCVVITAIPTFAHSLVRVTHNVVRPWPYLSYIIYAITGKSQSLAS